MYNDSNFFYYNNPANYGYMNYGNTPGKVGLFSKLRGIKWGDFLNNTSRTLNVINQAIPIVYQVKPLITNAKTMLRIANIIKSDEKSNQTTNKKSYQQSNDISNYDYQNNSNIFQKKEENYKNFSSNQPTFFL